MSLKNLMLLLMALVIMGSLLGCAQAPASEADTGDQPAAEELASAEDEVNVATFIMWQDFIDLDMRYAFASEISATLLCYENLVYYDPNSGEFSPGLATSWEVSDDGTEWTFKLREGVKFQDGADFNAEAVKSTVEFYTADEFSPSAWLWGPIEKVEVIDEYNVKFTLSFPAPFDIITSSAFVAGMISPKVVDQPKEWFDEGRCVGTGPYTIESFDQGQRLIMTKFDDYWGGWSENQYDKVVFEIVLDSVVAEQMMESGDATFYRDWPSDKLGEAEANEDLKVSSTESYAVMAFNLNTTKPPLDNKLVRQALAYSFPYDQFTERTGGYYTQPRGVISPHMWGYGEDLPQYEYDLDKARELLAEAGYPDGGFELEITYMADFAAEVWAAELWTFPLDELGITAVPQAMTYESMVERIDSDPTSAQDITPMVWYLTYVNPYDVLYYDYSCDGDAWTNFSRFCDPAFDTLINDGFELSATDRDAATEKFVAAQEILVEESPAVLTAVVPQIWVYNAEVEGFVDNPAYPNVVFFHDLTISE